MPSNQWRLLFLVYIGILAALTSHCSNMQCNNLPQRAWPSPSPSPEAMPQGVFMNTPPAAATSPSPSPSLSPEPQKIIEPTVMVSKPTGERQCQTKGGVTLEQMKTQLTTKRIPVFESHTQADGFMHMALCGAPAGTIHIFTIPMRLKARALKLGFKLFKPKT